MTEARASRATVLFAPRRPGFWVRGSAWSILVLVAFVLMIVEVAREPRWTLLGMLPLAASLLLATPRVIDLTAIRVEPGVAFTRIGLLARRRLPAGSVRIVHYASVVRDPVNGGNPAPTGPIDRRWAVVFVDGRPAVRLSMHQWSREQLVALAAAIPAQLQLVDETVGVDEVRAAEPQFYTWWENHLGAYWAVFWVAIFVIPVSIVLALVSARI